MVYCSSPQNRLRPYKDLVFVHRRVANETVYKIINYVSSTLLHSPFFFLVQILQIRLKSFLVTINQYANILRWT